MASPLMMRRGSNPSSSSSTFPVTATAAARAPAAKRAPTASTSASVSTLNSSRRPLSASKATSRAGALNSQGNNEALQAMTAQMGEMRISVEALEKERDFYFGKVSLSIIDLKNISIPVYVGIQLREIEIIVAARLEEPDESTEQEILKRVQDILYQTEVSIKYWVGL